MSTTAALQSAAYPEHTAPLAGGAPLSAGGIPVVDSNGRLTHDVANLSYDAAAHALTLGGATSIGGILTLLNGLVPTGAHGEAATLAWGEELLTLSTGGLTTNTAANLLPANSLILAVVARVTTALTVTTSWGLSDPTTANRFAATNATLTIGATSVGILQWSGAVTTLAAGPSQAAAAPVRVTCVGSNPGAGVVRIGVLSLVFGAPTN